MKAMIRSLAVVGLVLPIACTWVPLKPGGEAIGVRSASDVGACKRLGKTNTRTARRIGPIPRRESKVEEELVSLARNEAVRMGGNTIVALAEPKEGEQAFGIYRCP